MTSHSRRDFFAEDSPTNSMMPEPVVGRDAIIEFAGTWSEAEIVIERQVVEADRVVMGWRERRHLGGGKWSGWYRRYSSFVFNADGEVQEFEGMFNAVAMKPALQGDE